MTCAAYTAFEAEFTACTIAGCSAEELLDAPTEEEKAFMGYRLCGYPDEGAGCGYGCAIQFADDTDGGDTAKCADWKILADCTEACGDGGMEFINREEPDWGLDTIHGYADYFCGMDECESL